ncbi:MAG: 2-isopropylmalate synthase [Gammaproteobacteria bacterium]|nr:2-isopropylmalate synthase [Gammaproteobacteria bacterium]
MADDNRIYIFDTTLRDGQQSPGAGMSFEDNLIYAQYASKLNIDVLEAGFPAASQTDFEIVRAISQQMADQQSDMVIAGLCQLREAQVVKTMEALAPSIKARKARVHTYVPVDPNLMQASLGKLADDKQQIIHDLYRLIKMATDGGFEVEFSPEGYSRMGLNFDFVTDLIRAAVSAGAGIINCPDTIGGASRYEGEHYFVKKMQQHADIISKEFPQHKVIWSAHCHNDFGLALENSITAAFDGPVRQIEGCMNGVGERAGNVSLEQCIMYIKSFGEKANPAQPYYTNIDITHLQEASNFIAQNMLPRQPHTPITGENAARHTSGGHTNAVLKNPLAYQPFDPASIGSNISFVFGPLSGGNHAKRTIEAHGYKCDESEKAVIAQAIKDRYADRRKGITDFELIEAYRYFRSPIKVKAINYARTDTDHAHLTLIGHFFGQENISIEHKGGNSVLAGLVDAIRAHYDINIIDYSSQSDGKSAHAKCLSRITIRVAENRIYVGEAIDADIHISALTALINAVNESYIMEFYSANVDSPEHNNFSPPSP